MGTAMLILPQAIPIDDESPVGMSSDSGEEPSAGSPRSNHR
jgi:hypothetical protein